ncbi:MAG: S41 family peptidase, partial [Anaerolineaceae bacterium]|nr:S41 family peptidase [Anaerolineaceae bacterium]
MYRLFRVIAILMVLALFSAGGFVAGVVVDRKAFLPNAVTIAGTGPGAGKETPSPNSSVINLNLINEAYKAIEENYADRDTLQKTDMTYSAISGMVDSLGDTGHSRFLSPDMVESEKRSIEGEFEGIGALLNVNAEGNPVILAPMDDSPAQRAGLLPGDIIMAVNGEDVSHASLSEVVRRVLGPAGTQVTLTILTPETDTTRDVTITRAKIVIKNVTWQMLPGTNVAHIRVASYSQNVSKDLQNALQQAKDQSAKGILLDLRNNPGGLLNEATEVIGQFIKDGTALKVKDAQGNVRAIPAGRNGIATDIPLVVLINKGSASAAEITAGAIQDYQRAKLVGETTFGTGTVLNQFRLSDGSAILLATELWLTPNERVIWHQGIKPDVEVKLPATISPSLPETERNLTAEDLKNLKDTQLTKG